MDRLNRLTETVNELSRLSKEIIKRLIPLMEEINEENNDFVKNLRMKGRELTDARASKLLQEAVMGMTVDARTVQRELPLFSGAIMSPKDFSKAECGFMKEVWYGDMYGVEGVEGLLALKRDLEDQLRGANEDRILELAMRAYGEEK